MSLEKAPAFDSKYRPATFCLKTAEEVKGEMLEKLLLP
jgi:hypothetical protein